ncbi:MAG: hypothetical protein GF372_09960 [Candidatus Marinimicrobia bacterium]|nr:hypothetical protein [Candidatus Neomarinimicrobiota bacterium]
MSEAIVFVIGAITGIFIISQFTKSRLDNAEQGTHTMHHSEERERAVHHNRNGKKPGPQQTQSEKMYNS